MKKQQLKDFFAQQEGESDNLMVIAMLTGYYFHKLESAQGLETLQQRYDIASMLAQDEEQNEKNN